MTVSLSARRKIKIMLIAICSILIFGVIVTGAMNVTIVASASGNIKDIDAIDDSTDDKVDAIIVLGCKVFSDTTVSPILKDRLMTAISLYNKGVSNKILVSGDHGTKGYNEVRAMKTFLMNEGIPRDDIIMDHAGFDTYDTMYRARNIFGIKNACIVTQKFHMGRSLYIAKRFGLNVYGVTSDLHVYSTALNNNVREYAARVKAVLEVEILKRQAQCMGDSIPIETVTGRETEDEEDIKYFDELEREITNA